MADWLLLLHFANTAFLCGLIVYVQWVHYPLFRDVPPAAFTAYHNRHMRLTGHIAAPAMLMELALALWFPWREELSSVRTLLWWALLPLAFVWLSTFVLQVPLHQKLSRGFDREAHFLLVRTNWIRTIAWLARLVLLGFVVWLA